MVQRVNVQVDGLDSLIEKIDGFNESLMNEFRDDIGPKVAQMMHRKAAQHVPVDTGNLRESIHEFDTRRGIDAYDMGIAADARQVGVSSATYYAPYVEYGTGTKGDPAVMHVQKDHWYSYNPNYDPEKPEGKDNRKFLIWYAQSPKPFMRTALKETRRDVVKLMREGVEAAFK